MSMKPSDKPPSAAECDPKRNIPGRVRVVVEALVGLLFHDEFAGNPLGRVRPLGVPEPGEGAFFRYVGKIGRWLQTKLDPPKKSN
jgi:hypothetical protein